MATIAMIIGPEFEDSEGRIPLDRLRSAGHTVVTIGRREGETVTGKNGDETIEVDLSAHNQDATSYDALVIPGGKSPANLRGHRDIIQFVKDFWDTGRPVAAVCHGPQLLAEAGLLDGITITSWPKIKDEMKEAGARWVDQEVVTDGQLITSRKPDDLDAFCNALLTRLPGKRKGEREPYPHPGV